MKKSTAILPKKTPNNDCENDDTFLELYTAYKAYITY